MPDTPIAGNKCPACGSEDIGGLMAAFWAPINSDNSLKLEWRQFEGETELGSARLCYACGHEWDWGDTDDIHTEH